MDKNTNTASGGSPAQNQHFSIIPREFNLTQADILALEKCGIPLELQKAYGVRRVTDEQGAALVGQTRNGRREFSGLAFPCYSVPGSSQPQEYELRRDHPDIVNKNGEDKEEGKYLRPPGRANRLDFPRDVTAEELADPSILKVVCEGRKKFLAMVWASKSNLAEGEKRRFLPIGIPGVNNWRGTTGRTIDAKGQRREIKGLLTGFQKLNLKHSPVVILFDNDTHMNYKVRLARQKFGEALKSETEAAVYFVDLPKSDKKLGIDDLIGAWQKEHGKVEAVNKLLELLKTKYFVSDELKSFLLGGKLVLGISPAERGKFRVTLNDKQGAALAIDAFNLAADERRTKFIKQVGAAVPLSDADKQEISHELMQLAGVSDLLVEPTAPDTLSDSVIETSFHVLKNGQIIEQIRGGFAVYDPDTNEHSIQESVVDSDGTTYKPVDDELFQKSGGIQLADELTEYNSKAELIAEIANYLSRYLDLKPLQLKLTALYILFTYIFDSVLELSYLNATGDAGSGKSRFGLAVCIASHRGLSLINPSAASLFRIVDKFKPSLFLDEFNSDVNSDDAAAIVQILNAGFQRTAQIPRQVATADGKFKTEMFDGFCPKIIGSLKQSASNAFNSRCIEIQMERTSRNDIPLRLSHNLLNDAQKLRNKLTLWRLRNIQNDFEAKLDRAERELRQSGIMPRSIQINIPLFALIEDEELKRDFINLLKGRDEVLHEEKQATIDGEIVRAFHAILFTSGYDVAKDEDTKEAVWKVDRPANAKPCEDLRIEKITLMLNDTRKEKEHLNEKYVGKKISGLGLRSAQILSRKSDYHKKSAVIFDSHRLAVIFQSYGLPVPADFSLDQLDQSQNSNDFNNLTRSKENYSENGH